MEHNETRDKGKLEKLSEIMTQEEIDRFSRWGFDYGERIREEDKKDIYNVDY